MPKTGFMRERPVFRSLGAFLTYLDADGDVVRIGEPVSGPLRHQQRRLVQDPNEAGRIAARGDVAASVRSRGREADEG